MGACLIIRVVDGPYVVPKSSGLVDADGVTRPSSWGWEARAIPVEIDGVAARPLFMPL